MRCKSTETIGHVYKNISRLYICLELTSENISYQRGSLSWFVNAWQELGSSDWGSEARDCAAQDHCCGGGRGGGDWT